MTLQATQRISKHHNDSSGTTANLQTPQCTLQCRYYCCHFVVPSLQTLQAATAPQRGTTAPQRGTTLCPSVCPTFIFYQHSTTFRSQCRTQTTLHQGCTNPEGLNFVQWRVIFVDPQCASVAQNFEIYPRYLKKIYNNPALHEL